MIEDKLEKLTNDYEKVISELERLNKIALKLAGAIEILQDMKNNPEKEIEEDKD